MQNKIIILGILVIFFIALVIVHFYSGFSIQEGAEDSGSTKPFDDTSTIGAIHAAKIRKILKQVKPYGKLSNANIITQVTEIGDTQAPLVAILQSTASNKDKVGALNTLFGLTPNGLDRNLLIHYNFSPTNSGYVENVSKNTFLEDKAFYNAKIIMNNQSDEIIDSNNTAVNSNAIYLNGQSNKSGAFLQIPNLPAFEGDDGSFSGFSVSMWFYPRTVLNNFWNRLFDFGNGINKNNIFVSYSADGKLGNLYTAIEQNYYNQNIPTIMDKWNHYAWTIDNNGKWTIYLNNRIISSNKIQIPELVERNSNFIGYSNSTERGDDLYNGWIDDFRLYERALNNTEVTELYKMASKKVRDVIEGAELPIDIKIPPVSNYAVTDGTTLVKSPIDWKSIDGTSATTTITNSSIDVLNGIYNVTVSSSLNSADPQEFAYSCFNGTYSDPRAGKYGGNFYAWISNKAIYNSTPPFNYINSENINPFINVNIEKNIFSTTISRKRYTGEWVQLQLPTKIVIKSCYLHYPEGNTCGIMGAVIAGSNDEKNWKFVHQFSNPVRPTPKSVGYYKFYKNNTAYSYYRFIITHADTQGTPLVGINELILST